MRLSKEETAAWRRLGQHLGAEIFDLFESLPDAMRAASASLSEQDRATGLRAAQRIRETGAPGDAKALWQLGGAEFGFGRAKDVQAALDLMIECLKSPAIGGTETRHDL